MFFCNCAIPPQEQTLSPKTKGTELLTLQLNPDKRPLRDQIVGSKSIPETINIRQFQTIRVTVASHADVACHAFYKPKNVYVGGYAMVLVGNFGKNPKDIPISCL